ncbi:MAG: helix-turn-helix transcriptional regulator [Clostridiales bacterium]|nr:helix-turn-helix transcriptional regulator [Clostridiales bacterium]
MKFSDKIKELRIEKGLSQSALAKKIGASQKAVDYWELGINEPKLSYIMGLVEAFGLSYDEFFSDIDNPSK